MARHTIIVRRAAAPLLLAAACAASGCGGAELEVEGTAQAWDAPVVDGTSCAPWVRAAIVGVGLDSPALPLGAQSRCSGTLIAPNLVLTARHCVARLLPASSWPAGECHVDGSINPGFRFGPATAQGVAIYEDLTGPAIARAVRPLVPTTSAICNNDVALLLLDRRLSAKQPAPVRALVAPGSAAAARVTPARDPTVLVAGFGLLDADVENDRGCQQRKVAVLADGSQHVPYLGTYEFVTTYGICSGDSGGPVFDQAGRLVGVTSRGQADCHGAGIYPDLAHHRAWLQAALQQAAAAP